MRLLPPKPLNKSVDAIEWHTARIRNGLKISTAQEVQTMNNTTNNIDALIDWGNKNGFYSAERSAFKGQKATPPTSEEVQTFAGALLGVLKDPLTRNAFFKLGESG